MSSIKGIIFLVLLSFFLLVTFHAFSLEYTGNIVKDNFSAERLIANQEEVVSEYNNQFENIPEFARNLLGNEKINLIISDKNNKTENLALTTKNGKIISNQKELYTNPTFTVTTSIETINSIAASKDPKNDFKTNLLNNNIKINPVGLSQKVKYKTAILVLKASDLF